MSASPSKRVRIGSINNHQEQIKDLFDEVDLWRIRCKELETSLCQVNTDLELANIKVKKTKELEHKVDMILQHNSQLLQDNSNLSKNLNQKKAESDIWKGKYESQTNLVIQLRTDYEFQLKKAYQETDKYKDQLDANQIEYIRQLEDIKNQLETQRYNEVSNLKKAKMEDVQIYEEQIKKLRDIVEDSQRERNYIQGKIIQQKQDFDLELVKMNQEKERLKQEISELDLIYQHRMKDLEDKLQKNHKEETRNMRKVFENEQKVYQSELQKVMEFLELKNLEIEGLIQQNKEKKENSEEEMHTLRCEILDLKERINKILIEKERELELQKRQLQNSHEQDLNGLKYHYENQLNQLEVEIASLKEIQIVKQKEIEQQISSKQQQRDNYNNEVLRLNNEIENLKNKLLAQEHEQRKQVQQNNQALEQERQKSNEFSESLKRQIKLLEGEIEHLKNLLQHKNQEFNKSEDMSKEIRVNLESDIKNLHSEIDKMNLRYLQLESDKNQTIENLRQKAQQNEIQTRERFDNYDSHLDRLKIELNEARDQISLLQEENGQQQLQIGDLEQKIKLQNNQLNKLDGQIQFLEQQKDIELEQQKNKLQTDFDIIAENLKNKNNGIFEDLQVQLRELKNEIEYKNQEIRDLKYQNEELVAVVDELEISVQQLQEYEKKIASLGADLMSTKNLYGVIIKTKNKYGSPSKRESFPHGDK